MTGPDLFQHGEAPADPPTVMVVPRRRRRFGRRRIVVGSALLAVLVTGGLVVALLMPGGGAGGTRAAFGGTPGDVGESAVASAPLLATAGGGGLRGAGRLLGDDTLLFGRLVSTGAGTLVVAQDSGPTRTVRTNDSTKVVRAGKKGLAALTAGDRVVIRVSGTGDAATAVFVRSPKAHVTGTVTALSGDTATVLRADGLSATVSIAALDPKPAVGDLIAVSGKADGSTLVAERSRPLPKAS